MSRPDQGFALTLAWLALLVGMSACDRAGHLGNPETDTGDSAGTTDASVDSVLDDGDADWPGGDTVPDGDMEPESLVAGIYSPRDGAWVEGLVQVMVTASPAQQVRRMVFRADGEPFAQVYSPPFVASWDTGNATEGTHVLDVLVYQGSGPALTARVQINVAHGPPAFRFEAPAPWSLVGDEFELRLALDSIAPLATLKATIEGATPTDFPPDQLSAMVATYGATSGPLLIHVVATDVLGRQSEDWLALVLDHPPVVAIESPLDGAQVSGIITFRAHAFDPEGLRSLVLNAASVNPAGAYYGDQADAAAQTDVELDLQLDTSKFPFGTVTFKAYAEDLAGQATAAQIVGEKLPVPSITLLPCIDPVDVCSEYPDGTHAWGMFHLETRLYPADPGFKADLFVDGQPFAKVSDRQVINITHNVDGPLTIDGHFQGAHTSVMPQVKTSCDPDRDGADSVSCGGADCDDQDPDAFPGADDPVAGECAEYGSGGWTSTLMVPGQEAPLNMSAVAAIDGTLRLAFRRGSQGLVYAVVSNGDWQEELVDPLGDHPTLRVDAAGEPTIGYLRAVPSASLWSPGTGQLALGRRGETGWVTDAHGAEIVLPTWWPGELIRLDAAGSAFAVEYDPGSGWQVLHIVSEEAWGTVPLYQDDWELVVPLVTPFGKVVVPHYESNGWTLSTYDGHVTNSDLSTVALEPYLYLYLDGNAVFGLAPNGGLHVVDLTYLHHFALVGNSWGQVSPAGGYHVAAPPFPPKGLLLDQTGHVWMLLLGYDTAGHSWLRVATDRPGEWTQSDLLDPSAWTSTAPVLTVSPRGQAWLLTSEQADGAWWLRAWSNTDCVKAATDKDSNCDGVDGVVP
jgi:hypothetical protein